MIMPIALAALARRSPGLHVADDAPRERAGDLHARDSAARRVLEHDRVLLVVERRLVGEGGAELARRVLHVARRVPSTGLRFTCTSSGDMKMLTRVGRRVAGTAPRDSGADARRTRAVGRRDDQVARPAAAARSGSRKK